MAKHFHVSKSPTFDVTYKTKMTRLPYGIYYQQVFLETDDSDRMMRWLNTIHPIWEERYSKNNPPPPGQTQRQLLRPVYWLGNWQFACLNYYHPPRWVKDCCVEAEPFPGDLQKLVARMEKVIRETVRSEDIPKNWKLNTCLVNLYGSKVENGKKTDCARVGEHKDFEPGPVASLSMGERALFQFVSSQKIGERDAVKFEKWLDPGSLITFGGKQWKEDLFHRVQRVDKRDGFYFPIPVAGFKTRRVNLTFRYIPEEVIVPFKNLPKEKQEDVLPYVEELAKHSSFYKSLLN